MQLVGDTSGQNNWSFNDHERTVTKNHPTIERLVVVGGVLRFDDARMRTSFVGSFSANEGLGQPSGGHSVLDGAFTAGAAGWSGTTPTARVPHLLVEAKVLPLLAGGRLVLPLLEADHPVVSLLRDSSGRDSWNVTGEKDHPFKAPPISHLIISDGAIKFDDLRRKLHFNGTLSSSEEVNSAGRGTFRLDGQGLLNNARFVARVTGGPLLNVDASRPYPFDARLEAGPTRVRSSGTVAHPFDFAVVSGKLFMAGPDLADLYNLTGLALPSTPPYDLAAGFSRHGALYALRGIQGRVGASDLDGSLSVDATSGRPFVKADLAAVVGGVPKHTAGQPCRPPR